MKSLVIVDPQVDFITGILGSKEAQKVLPKIIEYVKNFDGLIYYTMDEHWENDGETRENTLLPKHCMQGTEGQKVPEELETLLKKKFAECYFKDSFMPYEGYEEKSLEEGIRKNYENVGKQFKNNVIYVCGYCTDICVLNVVLYLRCNFPNDTIIVLKNLCAGSTPEKHEMTLEVMKSNLIEVEE